jgi:hypothetical protein
VKTITHFCSYVAQFFLQWELFQTKVVDKIKTYIFFQKLYFESRTFYEITWKKYRTAGQATEGNITWRTCIACWMPKVTNTLIMRNTYCFSTAKRLHECASLLRYTYLACHVQLYLQHFSVGTNYRVLVRLHSPINIYYHTYGVPGAKRQPVSPDRVSIMFPPRLRSYFGCVSSLGVWTQEPRAVRGPTGVAYGKRWWSWSLCVRHLVHWLGLSQRGICWSSTAVQLSWRVHSHHKC